MEVVDTEVADMEVVDTEDGPAVVVADMEDGLPVVVEDTEDGLPVVVEAMVDGPAEEEAAVGHLAEVVVDGGKQTPKSKPCDHHIVIQNKTHHCQILIRHTVTTPLKLQQKSS